MATLRFSVCYVLMVVASYCARRGHCQQQMPIAINQLPRDFNTVRLECERTNGDSVSNPVFYRNGVSQEDECLSSLVELNDGSYRLPISPACEGHYMCGIDILEGAALLSGPTTLYAFPRLVPTSKAGNLNPTAREGDNITLPCSIEPSALGQFSVQWTRHKNGARVPIDYGAISEQDYSLTLTNVTTEDTGSYFCSVTASKLLTADRTLNGRSVQLRVFLRHNTPEFTTPVVYTTNEQGRPEFTVIAKGSPDLMIRWLKDGNLLNSTSHIERWNNIVKSRLRLSDNILATTNITVEASNVDALSGQKFSTRMTVLLFFSGLQPTASMMLMPFMSTTVAISIPLGILCVVLFGLLVVAGLVILLVFLKGRTKDTYRVAENNNEISEKDHKTTKHQTSKSVNPIGDIFSSLGRFLQQKPQSDFVDLNILGGLSQAVTSLLNQEHTELSDEAVACMEEVKSSLEETQACIRQLRREQKKKTVNSNTRQDSLPHAISESNFLAVEKASGNWSELDSGKGESLDEVDYAEEETEDGGEHFRKIVDLHSTVSNWLACRTLKRQNAVMNSLGRPEFKCTAV